MTAPAVQARETVRPEFPAVVHTYTDALRLLRDGPRATSALAKDTDRDPANMRRDVHRLRDAGVIQDDAGSWTLTDKGRRWVEGADVAEGLITAAGAPTALHAQLEPHPLNPRKDFDSDDAQEALDERRESILTQGQLFPLIVRPQPTPGKWWIIDGESRWRAIGQAIWDGDWPEDRPIRIEVREVQGDADHLMLSLTANMQRAALKPIEEGHAFAAAVHEFGLSTEDLAHQVNKSQRYVQQRMALLKLDEATQDRMRLPRDHPDYLSFKAARSMTQTPREDAAPGLGQLVEQHGPASMASVIPQRQPTDEPGSPPSPAAPLEPAAAPPFGSTLTDREALLLVEIADKADRDPDPDLGSEHYTRCRSNAVQGAAQGLVNKGLITFRSRGMTVCVRARMFTTGLKEWLDELGFDQHRADVLFEMRVRVLGHDKATALAADGQYATDWLNAPYEAAAAPVSPAPQDVAFDPAEQPELIEATEEEKAARIAAQEEARLETSARQNMAYFAGQCGDWMAFARFRGATDYLQEGPALKPEDACVWLMQALARGDITEAGSLLATLYARAGKQGSRETLRQMPLDLIAQVMSEARVPTPPVAEAEAAE